MNLAPKTQFTLNWSATVSRCVSTAKPAISTQGDLIGNTWLMRSHMKETPELEYLTLQEEEEEETHAHMQRKHLWLWSATPQVWQMWHQWLMFWYRVGVAWWTRNSTSAKQCEGCRLCTFSGRSGEDVILTGYWGMGCLSGGGNHPPKSWPACLHLSCSTSQLKSIKMIDKFDKTTENTRYQDISDNDLFCLNSITFLNILVCSTFISYGFINFKLNDKIKS